MGGIGTRVGRGGRVAALAGAVSAAALWVGIGAAQERRGEPVPPNPALTFDLGLELEADDDGTDLRADLGLAYLSRTRTEQLRFSLGTGVLLDGDGTDILPVARLSYARQSGAAALELTASYRLREVDGISFLLDPEADDPDEVALVEDDGRLGVLRAGLGLTLWRDAPVGLELGAEVLRRDYSGTSDPDLSDSGSDQISAALRVTPRAGLDLRLTAARARSFDEDVLDSESETTRLGVGVAWTPMPDTALSFELAHAARSETRNAFAVLGDALVLTGGRETVETDAVVGRAALVQARPNGTRSLSAERVLSGDGTRLEVAAARALELPRGAALEIGIGAAHFEGGETVATAQLGYARALADGAGLRATLSRTAATDSEEQDIASTRANLAWSKPLSPVSELSVEAGLARIEVVEGFEADETAATFAVGYGRALTEDWSLQARYAVRAAREDGASTRNDTRVTLGLGRSFTFRP